MICLVCTTSLFGWAQNWMTSCRLCDELDVHLEHRWHLKSTVMLCYYKYIVQNNMRQLGCTVFIGARMSTSIRVLLYDARPDARRLRCGGIERCHQLAKTYWHCHWDAGHEHKYLITYDTNALSKKLVKSTSQPNSCMSYSTLPSRSGSFGVSGSAKTILIAVWNRDLYANVVVANMHGKCTDSPQEESVNYARIRLIGQSTKPLHISAEEICCRIVSAGSHCYLVTFEYSVA